MTSDDELRTHLIRLLDWRDAHVNYDAAVDGIPAAMRGTIPPGLQHSPWQIIEHLRIAQHDILDFCVNPAYQHDMKWPDDYWPSAAPQSEAVWAESIASYQHDLSAVRNLVRNQADLFATIPHGTGQTYLREILLVADHAAYHVGELVLVRRLLGIWPS
jgi:hypothetical protein